MKYNFIKIIIIVILLVFLIPSCRKKNRPPHSPYTPSGPKSFFIYTSQELTSLAIDPDSDSVAIRFNWGDGNISNWSRWVKSGELVSMSHTWSNLQTYYIQSQAIDIQGLTSEWSLPFSIYITVNQPPDKPAIPSGPLIGYVDSAYIFASSGFDLEGDSIVIRFDWGDGDTSDWSWLVPSGFSVRMLHSWEYPDTYYIKAQAKDNIEQISEWSDEHQIIILTKNNQSTINFSYQNNGVTW